MRKAKTSIRRYASLAVAAIMLLAGVQLFTHFYGTQVQAVGCIANSNNVRGWAWSETIGWISMNCEDRAVGTENYGVNIDASGNFVGYAWSEHVGWVRFNPPGPGNQYPTPSAAPAQIVKVDTSTPYKLKGWARVCNANDPTNKDECNRAGNQGTQDYGWIMFRGTVAEDAFVDADTQVAGDPPNKRRFKGWAFGGPYDSAVGGSKTAVLGWISFNCSDPNAGGCTAQAPSVPPSTSYHVWTTATIFGETPQISNVRAVIPTNNQFCDWSRQDTFAYYSVQFDYLSPPNTRKIESYKVRVKRAGGAVWVEDGPIPFSATAGNPNPKEIPQVFWLEQTEDLPARKLAYGNINYEFGIQVKNEDPGGRWSNWVDATINIDPPSHRAPAIDFTPASGQVTIGATVTFDPRVGTKSKSFGGYVFDRTSWWWEIDTDRCEPEARQCHYDAPPPLPNPKPINLPPPWCGGPPYNHGEVDCSVPAAAGGTTGKPKIEFTKPPDLHKARLTGCDVGPDPICCTTPWHEFEVKVIPTQYREVQPR